MDDSLEAVNSEDWHPQDVVLVSQALNEFAEQEEVSRARGSRAFAILFRLIDTADIQYEHTEFSEYEHLSDFVDEALIEWMENQADDSWGEDLVE